MEEFLFLPELDVVLWLVVVDGTLTLFAEDDLLYCGGRSSY